MANTDLGLPLYEKKKFDKKAYMDAQKKKDDPDEINKD